MTDNAVGFGFGLAGTTGVEGLTGGASPGLKSRSLVGFGAGEMGREGGWLVEAVGGTSVGLLTLELEEVPIFSNRARKDDTGF